MYMGAEGQAGWSYSREYTHTKGPCVSRWLFQAPVTSSLGPWCWSQNLTQNKFQWNSGGVQGAFDMGREFVAEDTALKGLVLQTQDRFLRAASQPAWMPSQGSLS